MHLLLSLASAGTLVDASADLPWLVRWQGEHLVTLGSSGMVRIYDEELNEISTFDVSLNTSGLTLSPDGRMLATQTWRGRSALYDVRTGDRLARVPRPDRWSYPTVVAGNDGRYLVASGGLLERHVDGAERVIAYDVWAMSSEVLGYRGETPYLWESGRLHVYAPEGERVLTTNGSGWALHPAGEGWVLYDYGRASEYIDATGRRALGFVSQSSTSFATSAELVALVDASGTGVELWEHQTGERRATLALGAGMVQAMAFSPDGRELAVATSDGVLQLVDVPERPPIDLRAAPGTAVVALAVDPAGERGLAVWPDGDVVVWDLDTGAVDRQLQIPVQAGWGSQRFAVSPDLAWALVADGRDAVRRIDLETGALIGSPMPGSMSQSAVAVGADGSWAIATDNWVRTWSPEGALVAELPMAPPAQMAVGEGGTRLAVADWNGGLGLWDAESGQLVASRASTSQWASVPYVLRLVDGGVAFVSDTGAHLWRPEGQETSTSWESPILGAVSLDGQAVGMGSWSGLTASVDLAGEQLGAERWGSDATGSSVAALAVDGSGGLLMANLLGQVVWSKDGEIQVLTGALPEVWGLDVHQGWVAVSHAFGVRVFDLESGAGRVLSDEGVRDLAFLPDGRLAGVDGQGREPPESAHTGEPYRYVWDVATGERSAGPAAWEVDEVRTLGWDGEVPGARLKRSQKRQLTGSVVDCPDGSRLLPAEYGWSASSTLYIVDPEGNVIESDFAGFGQVAHRCGRLPGHTSGPGPVVAALGTSGGAVFLVDVATGEVLAGHPGDGSQVVDIVQLPDGGLVVGYHSGAVRHFGGEGMLERLFYANGSTLAHDGERLR